MECAQDRRRKNWHFPIKYNNKLPCVASFAFKPIARVTTTGKWSQWHPLRFGHKSGDASTMEKVIGLQTPWYTHEESTSIAKICLHTSKNNPRAEKLDFSAIDFPQVDADRRSKGNWRDILQEVARHFKEVISTVFKEKVTKLSKMIYLYVALLKNKLERSV